MPRKPVRVVNPKFKSDITAPTFRDAAVQVLAAYERAYAETPSDGLVEKTARWIEKDAPKGEARMVEVRRIPRYGPDRGLLHHVAVVMLLFPDSQRLRGSRRLLTKKLEIAAPVAA